MPYNTKRSLYYDDELGNFLQKELKFTLAIFEQKFYEKKTYFMLQIYLTKNYASWIRQTGKVRIFRETNHYANAFSFFFIVANFTTFP